MRDEKKVFQLFGETSASIYPLARDVMGTAFEKHFTEQRFYQPAFMAYQLAPKPLTVHIVCRRTPYTRPETVKNTLNAAAEAGYLESDGKEGYLVSKKGSDAIEVVHKKFYTHVNQINQFADEKMKTLAGLMGKLVDSASQAVLKTELLCLNLSRQGHPPVEHGTLAMVDQYLDDMNAFRDDAHIAAWTPTGVNGLVWETLNFVWNGEAASAEKLAERLAVRNYGEEDYQAALDELVEKGWIEAGDEGFVVTEDGKKIRDDAEEDTNTNYFIPWKVFSDSELVQLEKLLKELKEINLGLVEEEQAD
jgi:ribosomal protein S19E (S16A)